MTATRGWRPFDRASGRPANGRVATDPADLERAVHRAVRLRRSPGTGTGSTPPVAELLQAWDADPAAQLVLGSLMARTVTGAITNGWSPDHLLEVARRSGGATHATLLGAVVADRAAPSPSLGRWAAAQGATRQTVLVLAVDLLGALWALPRLPGPELVDDRHDPDVDPKVLARVRGLLAKAESTTFGEEAEALTAKATELMARHAIDRAALQGRSGAPAARRLLVDDPYTSTKVQLLSQIADAQRCRVVWTKSKPCAVATVFGFADDLDTVELLFTSLLVQATTAMLAAGAPPQPAERRSRRFRHAFLLAYAGRVGQRLAQASARVVDEAAAADRSGSLLPVLAARSDAVDAAVDAACPSRRVSRISASDAAGWVAGGQAADRADLGGRRVAGSGRALDRP